MKRRRRYEQSDEPVELGTVLEPYGNQQWSMDQTQNTTQQEEFDENDLDEYLDFEDYSEEHEAADSETRFRVAIGVFDLISICLGILVILLLVSMLVTLFNWLRNDILHSALLLQSGLQ